MKFSVIRNSSGVKNIFVSRSFVSLMFTLGHVYITPCSHFVVLFRFTVQEAVFWSWLGNMFHGFPFSENCIKYVRQCRMLVSFYFLLKSCLFPVARLIHIFLSHPTLLLPTISQHECRDTEPTETEIALNGKYWEKKQPNRMAQNNSKTQGKIIPYLHCFSFKYLFSGIDE